MHKHKKRSPMAQKPHHCGFSFPSPEATKVPEIIGCFVSICVLPRSRWFCSLFVFIRVPCVLVFHHSLVGNLLIEMEYDYYMAQNAVCSVCCSGVSVFSVSTVDRMYTAYTLTSAHYKLLSFFLFQLVHRQTQNSCTTHSSFSVRSHLDRNRPSVRSSRQRVWWKQVESYCHLVLTHGSGASSLTPQILGEASIASP